MVRPVQIIVAGLPFSVEPEIARGFFTNLKRAVSYPRRYPHEENEFRRETRLFSDIHTMPEGWTTPSGRMRVTQDGWKFRHGAE